MSKKCKAYSASKIGLEPADNRKAFYAGWDSAIKEVLAQTKQEPVAYRYMDIDEPDLGFWFDEKPSDLSYLKCEPLYTTPPQRTWVGLTDDEIDFLLLQHEMMSQWPKQKQIHAFSKAIEAKLKQKNGYAKEKNT